MQSSQVLTASFPVPPNKFLIEADKEVSFKKKLSQIFSLTVSDGKLHTAVCYFRKHEDCAYNGIFIVHV